ncbi:MAG TPA: hypothetical protein DEB32_10190, partial [Stenotrophomonas sp.]|nr:hypothetical protein [Stenotrophomonas sp.]
MVDKKVKLKDQLGRVVRLDSGDAGATLGKNLYGPDGKLLTAQQIINPDSSKPGASPTIWKLIREIPANVQKVAALMTAGFVVRLSAGDWVTRLLAPGTGIEITNPAGEAGDPTIGLANVADTGAGTLLATTFDAKGRKTGSRAATITGTANQIVVTNGDAAAGLPTISLADLTDTGVGAALVKLSRDAKGRVSGTQAATTTDLAEGANLYFTNARADARITAQKGQPNGIADLDAGGKVPAAQIPAIDHNTGLSGLQGGTSGQYYHLTSAELARIPPIGGTDAKLLRGDSVWSNDLVGPLLVRDTMQITSGTPAFFQATSTGGIQSVLSSNDSLAGGVGFFGTLTAHDLAFVAGSGVWLYMAASGANLRPNVDNATAIGTGSNRFSVVFAATGSINTSDEREKTPVRPLEQAEISAAAQLGREIGAYKWLASVEAKGDAARWHIGMTVQRAIEVMQSHGLDPFAYGFICYDSWEEKPDQSSEWPDKLDD